MNNQALTSIIIITYNNLIYNQLCIGSIIRNTEVPYEFIFIDNNSTDGTLEYLSGIENATVISNNDNMGFAFACNQGIIAARGEYLLFLNNDTVMPEGWLSTLLEKFADPAAGIIGPMSFNSIRGKQKIDRINYNESTLEDFADFARQQYLENRHKTIETTFISGLCLLVRKKVIDQIGGFDTRFSFGWLEDDDFSLRARLKGYKILIARDVFIHHFGSKTFDLIKIDENSHFERNLRIFRRKWSLPTFNFEDIDLAGIDLAENSENIYFPPDLNQQTGLINQLAVLSGTDNFHNFKKQLDIALIKDEADLPALYCYAYIYIKEKKFSETLEILKKIMQKDNINKDICKMFSYTLAALGDQKMSQFFSEKEKDLNNFSLLHEILAKDNF
jgi:GT2 family glycosyltransferase